MAAILCVIVAEKKSSVCLLDGSLERMILISESKHGSSSRSASSSTRKDTFLKQSVKASLKMKMLSQSTRCRTYYMRSSADGLCLGLHILTSQDGSALQRGAETKDIKLFSDL